MVSTKRCLPGESHCLTKLRRSKLHQKPLLSEMGVVGREGIIAWDHASSSHRHKQQLLKLVRWGRERGGWGDPAPGRTGGGRELLLGGLAEVEKSEQTHFIFQCLPSVQDRRE